ncbi:hypothetical protein LRP88_03682 [Fusarium phalaenopsidis]
MLPFTICVVAGLQYLIHPQKLGSIQETINSDAIIPITLLTTDEVFGDLEGILQLFDSYDDVFNLEFGSVLVEKPGSSSNDVVNTTITGRPVYHLDQITAFEDMAELPSGPYFLHGPNLHQAWRLYDDEFGAFTFGVIPDDLYQPDDRAWKSLYKNPSDFTAEYARKLLDLGAVLVGKTKTSQFGTGAEWVDEQAPWSARGDGYERLKGGSVGATAAPIGHEWLQHSIGVDIDEAQQEALDGFVMTLEELLGVEAQRIDIGAAWAENPPDEASDEDMQAYMKHYFHAFDEFRHEYRQKTEKEAFAESTPQFFWDKCKATTETEHRENLRRLEIYRQWFHENIITPNADAILVLPCGKSSRVEHRDEAVAPPTISEGVGPEILASILGVPHLAVPFTQVPYDSRISGRTEYQTVCVSVIGPQGSDTDIIQVVKQALEKAHVRTRVETGRLAFPADTLRNGRYSKPVPQPPSLSDEL